MYEGGFCIGVRDDNYKIKGNAFVYNDYISKIETVASCDIKYFVNSAQPGMHLLSPQSFYPAYKTDVLEKGEYIFASAFYFATDGKEEISPKIAIQGNKVTVKQELNEKTITV